MGTDRQVVLPDLVAFGVEDDDRRVAGLVLGLNDDLVFVDRELIGDLLTVGHTLDEVVELDLTSGLDDGRGVVRIPLAEKVALVDLVTVLEVQP